MLTAEDRETLKRVKIHAPKFEKLLQRKLQEELDILPSMSMDKVQKHQGRALVLRELLEEMNAV